MKKNKSIYELLKAKRENLTNSINKIETSDTMRVEILKLMELGNIADMLALLADELKEAHSE